MTLSHPTSENILWKYVHLGGKRFFDVLFIERARFYNSVQCWAIIFDGWYFALHTLAYYCAGSLHIWLQPQHLSPTIQHQGQMKMKSKSIIWQIKGKSGHTRKFYLTNSKELSNKVLPLTWLKRELLELWLLSNQILTEKSFPQIVEPKNCPTFIPPINSWNEGH